MVSISSPVDAPEADLPPAAPSAHLKYLPLSLLSWNVAGLRDKLDDVSWLRFVDAYDILCFQETLSVDPSFLFPGYIQYLSPAVGSLHGSPKGGRVIFLLNDPFTYS